MIKRDGKEIVSANLDYKKKFKGVAGETFNILNEKKYTTINGVNISLEKDIENMIEGTIYYDRNFQYEKDLNLKKEPNPYVEVINETTTQSAVRLNKLKDVVALNFASGTNPGGGWLNGAKAQEESLMYRSALYSSLITKPMFYNNNILANNNYYSDEIIYSKKVPFFRNEYLLLEEPYYLSVITSPAPNLIGVVEIDLSYLKNIIDNRISKILKVAAMNGYRNIILGAWGCGAFRNPPDVVSLSFKENLEKAPYFDYVCFAIYDYSQDENIIGAFKKRFVS